MGARGGYTSEHRSAMNSTEMMEKSTRTLEEATRRAIESEGIGDGVLSDLVSQRETIQNMKNNMKTVDSELTGARQALGRMIAMAERNRLVTMVIASILGLGLAFWALCFWDCL